MAVLCPHQDLDLGWNEWQWSLVPTDLYYCVQGLVERVTNWGMINIMLRVNFHEFIFLIFQMGNILRLVFAWLWVIRLSDILWFYWEQLIIRLPDFFLPDLTHYHRSFCNRIYLSSERSFSCSLLSIQFLHIFAFVQVNKLWHRNGFSY